MALIKEPIEIDFLVDPRPLTKEEQQAVSDFIKMDKEKRKQKRSTGGTISKAKQSA